MSDKARRSVLTRREEQEVLALVWHTLNDSEIAEQLSVSVGTMKNSTHGACIKLGTRRRLEAAYLAIKAKSLRFLDIFCFYEIVEMAGTPCPEASTCVYPAIVESACV